MSRLGVQRGVAAFIAGGVFAAALAGSLPALSAGEGHDEHGGMQAGMKNAGCLEKIHLYLCAFHIAKENPKFQIEAHHYCSPAGKDVHQCVVFDGNGADAKLLGVEYIITDAAYRSLPDAEKKYWHPHAYEILSGQLVAPNMPKEGDDMFPGLIRTWGKTWHTWRDPATPYPVGEPLLMWSANGDGQIDDKLVAKRDAKFGIETKQIRERRKTMNMAVPSLPPPKSMDELGRQFTASGKDEPTMLK
ncbi:MAG: OBAP family protein [Phycisphaerae bacterium]